MSPESDRSALLTWGVAHLAELEALARKRRLRVEADEKVVKARDRILEGLSPKDRGRLTDRLLTLLDNSERLGLKMSHPGSSGWPGLLSDLSFPPFLLWMKGDLSALLPPGIAVVGAREAGPSACGAVSKLARELSSIGVCVVSGLARGVDGAAHRGAISGPGRTIAVVGTGLDRVYPAEHRILERDILAGGGLLLSEYPPGDGPEPWHFPYRNRLIVGLSVAVVVGPHRRRSGTYVTARIALEEGRELLVFDREAGGWEGEGPALLAGEGARRVSGAEEVLSAILSRGDMA